MYRDTTEKIPLLLDVDKSFREVLVESSREDVEVLVYNLEGEV